MKIFEFIPKEMPEVRSRVENWLKDYSPDADKRLMKYMSENGFDKEQILIPLALAKSKGKYGYTLNIHSLNHIVELAEENPKLEKLIEDWPFMLAKIGFIYEHAPTFILEGDKQSENIDNCVLEFTENYTEKYLLNQVNLDFTHRSISPVLKGGDNPRQVYMTTFWDKEHWDPVEYIKEAYEKNIKGVEYAVDFHPFNLNKLLPEEISKEKRQQIRQLAEKLNVKLTIHTAIVGPYTKPNFKKTHLFYDPADIATLHKETIVLAKDIGAGSITLHLIDPDRIQKVIEIIEFAKEYGVYVTLENYYHTDKINQTSDNFIEVLDLIVSQLPEKIKHENFGLTFDTGHYNIEGEDPVISAVNIGKWCKENSVNLAKVHATTNYGSLDCFPPHYSADVHDPVSYRGINNKAIIQEFRALGHNPKVVAEQISPLSEQDIQLIDRAMRVPILDSYEKIVAQGNTRLRKIVPDSLISEENLDVEAYNFIAEIDSVRALREHLIFRKVQTIEHMTSETAQEVTSILMRMSQREQQQIMEQIEILLNSVIDDVGGISQTSITRICEELSGTLYANLTRERLNRMFVDSRIYQKGDVICKQGTVGTEMYYIKDGEVDVFLNDQKIATLLSGEIFGEMAVLRNKPRSATVKASTQSKLGVLSRERIITSMKSRDDYAKAMLYNLCRILPERLRKLNDRYVQKIESAETFTDIKHESVSISDVKPIFDLEICDYDELTGIFYKEKVYEKNEVVVEENSKNGTVFFVKDGILDVVRHENGDTVVLAKLSKGNILGEMAMIDNSKRSATVVSLSESRLGYLSKEEFNRIMIGEKTDFSYKFLVTLCSTMLSRIASLDKAYMRLKIESK